MSFQGSPTNGYRIEFNTSLTGAAGWQTLGILAPNPTGIYSIADSSNDGSRLYRSSVAEGQVFIALDPTTPNSSLVQISASSQMEVLAGVFDVKSSVAGTMVGGLFNVRTTGASTFKLLKGAKIVVGRTSYSASITPGNGYGEVMDFENLREALPANQWVAIAVYLIVNPDSDGRLSGSTAVVNLSTDILPGELNNPKVLDANTRPLQVSRWNAVGNVLTFTSQGVVLHDTWATSTPEVDKNNQVIGQAINTGFSITAGSQDAYVSTDPTVALTIVTEGEISLTHLSTQTEPATIAGDTKAYYIVPAGTTRTFIFNEEAHNSGLNRGGKTVAITRFNFGTSPSSLTSNSYGYKDGGSIIYFNFAL